jgi:hypothetical protein
MTFLTRLRLFSPGRHKQRPENLKGVDSCVSFAVIITRPARRLTGELCTEVKSPKGASDEEVYMVPDIV